MYSIPFFELTAPSVSTPFFTENPIIGINGVLIVDISVYKQESLSCQPHVLSQQSISRQWPQCIQAGWALCHKILWNTEIQRVDLAVRVEMCQDVEAQAGTEMVDETVGAEAPCTTSTGSVLTLHRGESKKTCTQIEEIVEIMIRDGAGGTTT